MWVSIVLLIMMLGWMQYIVWLEERDIHDHRVQSGAADISVTIVLATMWLASVLT